MQNCPNCDFNLSEYMAQKESECEAKFEETHKDLLTKLRKRIHIFTFIIIIVLLISLAICVEMMIVQPANPKIGYGILFVLDSFVVVLFPLKLKTENKIILIWNLFRSLELHQPKTQKS